MANNLNPLEEFIKVVVDEIKFVGKQLTDIYLLASRKPPKQPSLTVEQANKMFAAADKRMADLSKPPISKVEISNIVSSHTSPSPNQNNKYKLEL